MSDEVSFKKEIVTPKVARIAFIQPQRYDQHITEDEMKEKIAKKSKEIMQTITNQGLVSVTELKIETTKVPKEVCHHENCKNWLRYTDYELAIKQCKQQHPNDVRMELTILGMVWCLVVDKKYEQLKGKVPSSGGSFVVYEMEDSTSNSKNTMQKEPTK